MIERILIANRGEIACRVIRTARRMGLSTIAVHSDADVDAPHVRLADEAVRIGPPAAAQSYLDIAAIEAAARACGADAVHPGYGFLSENRTFAEALDAAGVRFIGPPAAAIEAMGDKITSKRLAAEAGVSTVPGHMDLVPDPDEAARVAASIGYPVMIKASAGGGGKGMRIARDEAELREGVRAARSEAKASFGDDRLFIEKFVTRPRHIEIQILADIHGNCIHLGERECSIQRRNQKVVEEAPSPFLDAETRARMGAQAVALAQAVGYVSAGTVEFIVDAERNFYFLEMNTRLQVEHPVTELVTGLDLVEQMIRIADGARLPLAQEEVRLGGWAIESRIYAEDPYRKFLPSIGRIARYRPPDEVAEPDRVVRNDTGVEEGGEISVHYDPMIAKLCTWGRDRVEALAHMRDALDGFELEGIGHNLPFLAAVMDHPRFAAGDITTAFIKEEFPGGFAGVAPEPETLARIAAAAAAMMRVEEVRRSRISGRMSHHGRTIGSEWVVEAAGSRFALAVEADREGASVRDAEGTVRVVSDWVPGQRVARLSVDGAPLVLKVDPLTQGFRIRHRGADLKVLVRTPRRAELAALMPVKAPADTSRMLLCPMPGLVVRVEVAPGDEVQEGQALCTVEAMKMENILRAERQTTVARVNVSAGDSLAVDDVIMEFE